MIPPDTPADTAAGVLIWALLSGIVGSGLMPYGFLMYRQRAFAMSEHKKPTREGVV